MQITFVTKRLYTNRDLINDRYGRMFHFPVQLACRGHQVRVLALDYRWGRRWESQRIDDVEFVSVPASQPIHVAGLWATLRTALKADPPDLMLASGDTWIAGLVSVLARRLQIPWVFDVYDDYRHFASARLPGMRVLFNRMVREANAVLPASDSLAQSLRSEARRLLVAHNGIDPLLFRPIDRSLARSRLGIASNDIVVGYFGGITQERGIHVLLAAHRQLRERWPSMRLFLAGKVAAQVGLNAPGVDYRGLVPHEDIPYLIAACDVVTIPYLSTPLIEATHACKIAEYLACAVPVVATRVSDMPQIFREAPEALARPGDADDLADAIARQLTMPRVPPLPDHLTWARIAAPIADLLEELGARPR